MEDLTALPLKLASGVVSDPSSDAEPRLVAFLKARLETALHEQGIPVEVVRAVLSGNETRLARIEAMAKALAGLVGTRELADLVTGWRRVGVLGKAAATKKVDKALLKDDAEAALYEALLQRKEELEKTFESGDYAGYLRLLVELKPYIDRCLDEVLIMTDEAPLRENRQALLASAAGYWIGYADFSLLKSLVPSG
jgi:glycyl-tRNA synthetase beta chain